MLDLNSIQSDNWTVTWNSLKNKPFNPILPRDILIPFCLWNIWLTRNSNLFNKKYEKINASNVISRAVEYYLMVVQKEKDTTRNIVIQVKWDPP